MDLIIKLIKLLRYLNKYVKMDCNHDWEEDKDFKDGVVTMLFGPMNNVQQETRLVCTECGEVIYVNK